MTNKGDIDNIKNAERKAEAQYGHETGGGARVASYAVAIYEVWAGRRSVPDDVIDKNRDIFRMAAMLHDMGKVAISDTILKKPCRFNNAERDVMKQHPIMVARRFSDRYSEFDEMAAAAVVALTHHEKWDGTGYPGHVNIGNGKVLPGYEISNGTARPRKGQEILVFGRLVALADEYDTLGSTGRIKSDGTKRRSLRS